MAEASEDLIAITPAMREGSGLVEFSKKFPNRYFDVAIAEQHSVTFAAGLSVEKKKPVVAIYSTFLQRGYDQLIHDVAVQNLDVTFALDRSGLVGEDGPTHSGNYDIAYLRCIPNMVICTPSDENETRKLLTTAYLHNGPASVRYPRGTGPNSNINKNLQPVKIGEANIIKEENSKIVILNFGTLLEEAKQVSKDLKATLVDMRFVKPLDEGLIDSLASSHDLLVTLEENTTQGGAGSAVLEYLQQTGIKAPTLQLGLPDRFVDHGKHKDLLAICGLDKAGIERAVERRLVALSSNQQQWANESNQ